MPQHTRVPPGCKSSALRAAAARSARWQRAAGSNSKKRALDCGHLHGLAAARRRLVQRARPSQRAERAAFSRRQRRAAARASVAQATSEAREPA
eukprot:1740019-Prymnesium_polylepis.1